MGKVIDVHVHVGSSAALYVGGSIQIVTSRMSRHGITHSVVSPIPGFEDPEGIKSVKEMNAQVADIQKNNADVFPLVFGVAEARHGAKAAAEETAHALGELGMGGLMFHHDFAGVEIHAPVMRSCITKNPGSFRFTLHSIPCWSLPLGFGSWHRNSRISPSCADIP